MQRKIIRLKEVILLTGHSKSTIYRLIGEQKFPKQKKISERSSGWFSDEIQGWINSL